MEITVQAPRENQFQTFLKSKIIYSVDDIPLLLCYLRKLPTTSKKKVEYIEAACSFDIESTSFYWNGTKAACMYVWSLGLHGSVIIGRTWEEFVDAMRLLSDGLNLGGRKRLLCYIHNADFDFQFMRKWLTWEKVFSVNERKPLYMISTYGVEFRCSYKLSGYSLEYVSNHLHTYQIRKLVGDLDYKLLRHSKTRLTEKELGYIVNDAKAVMAYVKECMDEEGSITEIPLTKTGYVRRFVRQACFGTTRESRNSYHWKMCGMKLIPEEYKMQKNAFQGGFVHGSPFFVDKTIEDVEGWDFTSSYPAWMLAGLFPMKTGRWRLVKDRKSFDYFRANYCCIFEVEFTDIKSTFLFDYYISSSRTQNLQGEQLFNGRVVEAKTLRTTITELDFEIIEKTYKWKSMKIGKFRTYERDYLPKEFILAVLELYEKKTTLKGIVEFALEYLKSKEMLNSCYGMSVTDVCKALIAYENNMWDSEYTKEDRPQRKSDIENLLNKYNKNWNRFLFYPWGVYITAYARYAVWTGIIACGPDYLYCDTDSIKIRNAEKYRGYFDKYNAWITAKLTAMCNHYDIDPAKLSPLTNEGVPKPLGVWDFDGHYKRFKTLGAKRYLLEYSTDLRNGKDVGKIKSTVAGLSKKEALDYMLNTWGRDGIFEHFSEDLEIPGEHTGKQTHYYCDTPLNCTLTDYNGITAEVHEKSYIHLEAAPYSLSYGKGFVAYYKYIRGLTISE